MAPLLQIHYTQHLKTLIVYCKSSLKIIRGREGEGQPVLVQIPSSNQTPMKSNQIAGTRILLSRPNSLFIIGILFSN